MSSYESIQLMNQQIKKYMKSLEPLTTQLQEAFALNEKYISQIMLPYNRIFNQMEVLNKAIALPDSNINQIKRLSEGLDSVLPKYVFDFQATSTFIEALKIPSYSNPKFLLDFSEFGKNLLLVTDKLYGSYSNLRTLVGETLITLNAMPDYLIKPALNTSAQYKALRDLKFIEADNTYILEEDFDEILNEACDSTDADISRVEPNWTIVLKGAEQSLASSNPDKVRHTITSLRELITQIIHRFAPDDSVKEQYKDSKCYHKKKPTRRARLHYILTNRYGNDILLDFVDKDIEATLALFDIYQTGTHKIISTISNEELSFIVKRTKVLISQLLDRKE